MQSSPHEIKLHTQSRIYLFSIEHPRTSSEHSLLITTNYKFIKPSHLFVKCIIPYLTRFDKSLRSLYLLLIFSLSDAFDHGIRTISYCPRARNKRRATTTFHDRKIKQRRSSLATAQYQICLLNKFLPARPARHRHRRHSGHFPNAMSAKLRTLNPSR